MSDANKPDADGWIQWSGGNRPVPIDTLVQVKSSYGTVVEVSDKAQRWNWNGELHISAYRIVPNKVSQATKDSALDNQVGGDHYRGMSIQPIEYIHANNLGFAEGCVVKYVSRWKAKNGIADLEKARHFLDLLIELEKKADKE